jgi:diacylglycerol kinase family enzyme
MPGALLYRLAPLQAIIAWRPARFELTLDGVEREVTGHSVVVGNSGAYGRGLRIVPSADPFDGRLDVLLVKDGPKRNIIAFMKEARNGTHVRRGNVEVISAHEVVIAADRELPVCGDGENLTVTTACARIVPAALHMLTG